MKKLIETKAAKKADAAKGKEDSSLFGSDEIVR